MQTVRISREEAIKLLFHESNVVPNQSDVFDDYGNYCFPTDIVVEQPNLAIGTAKEGIRQEYRIDRKSVV